VSEESANPLADEAGPPAITDPGVVIPADPSLVADVLCGEAIAAGQPADEIVPPRPARGPRRA
jgi:hypothetical protein